MNKIGKIKFFEKKVFFRLILGNKNRRKLWNFYKKRDKKRTPSRCIVSMFENKSTKFNSSESAKNSELPLINLSKTLTALTLGLNVEVVKNEERKREMLPILSTVIKKELWTVVKYWRISKLDHQLRIIQKTHKKGEMTWTTR